MPEALGTERTWDYRYCWLRDSAFVVEALRRLSHLVDGERFIEFLRRRRRRRPAAAALRHRRRARCWSRSSCRTCRASPATGPVRIGNAAYVQTQNDIMGELILCLDTMTSDPRVALRGAGDDCRWSSGWWRRRCGPRPRKTPGCGSSGPCRAHYTFSKVLCWVAASRGADMAERHGRGDLAAPWRTWAAAERERVIRASLQRRARLLHPGARRRVSPTPRTCCWRRSASSTPTIRGSSRRSAPTNRCSRRPG